MRLKTLRKLKLRVGSSGWTVDDLDDPRIEHLWGAGKYEIIDGVLKKMPPASLDPNRALARLIFAIQMYLSREHIPGEFAYEVDYIVGPIRLAQSDVIFMTPEDDRRQKELKHARETQAHPSRSTRLLVPPTLVIESVSLGHARRDREIKREWYAEAGVPNYWIFDAIQKSIEVLVLADGVYRQDLLAEGSTDFTPALFAGLSIPLQSIWL